MNRSTVIWLLVIVVVLLVGFFTFGSLRTGTQVTGEQPSPHALDQSQ